MRFPVGNVIYLKGVSFESDIKIQLLETVVKSINCFVTDLRIVLVCMSSFELGLPHAGREATIF